MNFYVPTIGDSIYLLEPWTFTLHREHRNLKLAKQMEQCGQSETRYHYKRKIYVTSNIQHGDTIWNRVNWPVGEYQWHMNSPDETFVRAVENHRLERWASQIEDRGIVAIPYQIFSWNGDRAEVTLPTRTELKVDRIYIKSTFRDFDSITFRIGECPENKKLSKARFWVKLRDANKIVCDLYPVADEDAKKLFASTNRFSKLEDE